MKNDRVLITGCGGMLGNAVYPCFSSLYSDVLATDKELNEEWLVRMDVRDDAHLGRVFREYRPNLVIHLAAETSLEFCETHRDIAEDTNSSATEVIAKLCEEHGCTLVYISTAGVFDGLKVGYYTEEDEPSPIMVYGRTKREGELHAMKYCSRLFVVRAGWMMGGGRKKEKKFIYKILQQLGNGTKEIFAVDDKWGTPTYTYDFARNLYRLVETRAYGIYHMACEGKGTRYDVAREILEICGRLDIKLTAVSSDFFKKDYFAPRPPSEMMYNANLRKLSLNHMRPWKEALREYLENYFADYVAGPIKKSTPTAEEPQIAIRETKRSTRGEKFVTLRKQKEKG